MALPCGRPIALGTLTATARTARPLPAHASAKIPARPQLSAVRRRYPLGLLLCAAPVLLQISRVCVRLSLANLRTLAILDPLVVLAPIIHLLPPLSSSCVFVYAHGHDFIFFDRVLLLLLVLLLLVLVLLVLVLLVLLAFVLLLVLVLVLLRETPVAKVPTLVEWLGNIGE